MGSGPTVGHYHFEGWDLPTKYSWMHSGPGVQAATQVQDIVHRMAERMIASGDLVGRLLGGAEWVGAAATAAGQAMRRGAGQITQTAAEAATAQQCVTELSESFAATQHRVPAPNEVPTGLGDVFLYGAAEGFNALSPFDVQSPMHEAMAQRHELDQQANLALTEHMTTSRERVEAIPAITAPAPMTVTAQNTAPSGGGTVGQPSGVVSTTTSAGGAPTVTSAAGWGGGSPPPPSVGPPPGPGGGAAPVPPGVTPVPAGLAGAGDRPRPAGPAGTAGSRFGGAGFGPLPGGAGGVAAPRPGRSAQSVPPGGAGISGRGAPGLGGRTGGPAVSERGGGGIGTAGGNRSGAARSGSNASFLQPPVGGRRTGDDDTEHRDRFALRADYIVGELPLVAPAVIGETPEEEDLRLRRGREGR